MSVTGLGATILVAWGLPASAATAPPTSSAAMSIVSVTAVLPAQHIKTTTPGGSLTQSSTNVVTATTALTFKVRVHYAGSSQRAHVAVTLMISRAAFHADPILKSERLAIGPNQTKSVTFNHLGNVPFATRTNLTVQVASGKVKVYPVIFALG